MPETEDAAMPALAKASALTDLGGPADSPAAGEELPAMPKWLRISLGMVFLVLGIAGLFLPVLQGILFLVIAAGLLAPYSPFIRRQEERFLRRFPALAEKRQEYHYRIAARWRKWRHGD